MDKRNYCFLSVVAAFLFVSALANVGTTDLLVHYEFEGNFEDSSGNGFHGTPVGDAEIVFDEARNSNVLSLDGDDDIVEINSQYFIDNGFDLLDEITVAMWVYTSQDVSGIQFSGGMNTDWSEGAVHLKLNNGLVNVGINGGDGDVIGTTLLPMEEWHHIAFTASAVNFVVAVYYDGVQEGYQEPTTFPFFFDMALNPVIGAWDNGGDIQREWLGMKDDIRIYNHALSEDEMQELFESTSPVGVEDWSVY